MSTAELQVIKGGKQTFRTVEVVRQAESDRWAIAEAIVEDCEARGFGASVARAHDGNLGPEFVELCSEIAAACRGEGADTWKPKTVAKLRSVGLAWPVETRVAGATYGAHERMYAREDRVTRLERLVARSSDGKVNRNDVDLWLSTLKPQPVVGFLDGIEKAVRSALLAKGKPWGHVSQDDRGEIARRLRVIAAEIENAEGKFS